MKINVDALKLIMIEKKMSLKELSEQTGLSQITIASILKNGESRRFKTIGSLVNGLNVKPEDILVDDTNN